MELLVDSFLYRVVPAVHSVEHLSLIFQCLRKEGAIHPGPFLGQTVYDRLLCILADCNSFLCAHNLGEILFLLLHC